MNLAEKEEALGRLYRDYDQCTRCSQMCNPEGRKRKGQVFGSGFPNAHLMIVGEAPGGHEEDHKEPFWPSAPAGDWFAAFLASVGMTRDEVFIDNVVVCRPTEVNPKTGRVVNRKPTKDEIKKCQERLHRVIEVVDPLVILLLGDTALRALSEDKRSITAIARATNEVESPRIVVTTQGLSVPVQRTAFATFHPSYFLHEENARMQEGSDLHKAYLTWSFAAGVMDLYRNLYFGTAVPDRRADDE